MITNTAAKWFKQQIADHTTRHRLHLNGRETPWFIDKANCRAHFTQGEPCGLFGSGLGQGGIAGCFGAFRTVTEAKQAAIARTVTQ